MPERGRVLEIGKGRMIREGTGDVALLSLGTHLTECEAAATELEASGISVTIADARFAKPLDMELIARLAQSHDALITVEQGAMGGFGAMVLQAMVAQGLLDHGCRVRTLCLPDRFIDQASPAEMYRDAGLDAQGITQSVLRTLGKDAKVIDLNSQRG